MATAVYYVSERFDQATAYADQMWNEAMELINTMASTTYSIDWEGVEWQVIDLMGLDGLDPTAPLPPTPDEIALNMPEFTAATPEMEDIDVTTDPVPAFDVPDPGFEPPDPPVVEHPILTAEEPQVSDIAIPTAPDYDLPPVPQLDSISIPSPPPYNIPEFEGTFPVEDLTAPQPQFIWNEAEYDSDLKQALANKLFVDITEGGSGLDAETEQAIYDRAISRQELENQTLYDNTLNFFASRGYILPPGGLAGRMLEVDYKIVQSREDINNDILVQQSKLAQENTHFIITSTIENEKNLMSYVNAFQQRAFDAAKYVVDSALIVYAARIEAYKAKLTAYQTQASVYEMRIRGEIAKAEFYKAQIAAVQASVDIQRALIEAYTAQVQGIQALIGMYVAEMEGARIQADIDKTRVDIFRSQIEAYVASVRGVTARYEAYQAEMAGEVAKAEMYKARVQAYSERVSAYKAVADVDLARVLAVVEKNKGDVSIYRALVDKYQAEVTGEVARVDAAVRVEGLDVAIYEAGIKEYQAELQATTSTLLATVEDAKANLQLQLQQSDIAVREALGTYELAAENMRAAARVAAQLGAAAVSAVNASAHVGYGEQDSRASSDITSRTTSDSRVSSESFIDQHIYQS